MFHQKLKTMNFKLTLIALIFCLTFQAQEKKQNDTIKIEINSNTKTIYLLGGIASVITKEDLAFAKKYNIAPGSSKSFTAISNVALRFVVKLLLL